MDVLLIMIVTFPLLVSIYGTSYYTNPDNPLILGPADFIISWVLPAIAVINFWLYKQATPGKMAIGAWVVDARSGKTMTPGQAFVRYIAYLYPYCHLALGLSG